ncbi:hypothetical protein AB0D67_29595 [Streptosporangium sp. NPDC048047]|uniref:hypothetical protein n=1 Tax=unclassified Streptosporangium TaxID=2632669 RepID=UPI00343AC38E
MKPSRAIRTVLLFAVSGTVLSIVLSVLLDDMILGLVLGYGLTGGATLSYAFWDRGRTAERERGGRVNAARRPLGT